MQFNIKTIIQSIQSKIGKTPEWTFLQRKHPGQQAHEQIHNITNH